MKISVRTTQPEDVKGDALILPVYKGTSLTAVAKNVDKALHGAITDMIENEEFTPSVGSTVVMHTMGNIAHSRVVAVGLGEKKELTTESLRRALASGVKSAHGAHARSVVVSLDGVLPSAMDAREAGHAMTEGMRLAQYAFLRYQKEREQKAKKKAVTGVTLTTSDSKEAVAIKKGVAEGELFANATILARDMVNEPAVVATPKYLAAQARKIAKNPQITVKVYSVAEMKKLGMGSLLSVNAGSAQDDAQLIHLTYKPKKNAKKKIAICGKGITFDSGGLSLKPANYMDTMKSDMSGAAAVLGVFSAISELQPSVEVHGVIGATENMPSGNATRPGDVVTAYNGKTIEVKNTDAEGRLVLADCLAWAEDKIKPDYMIDLATLTGAAVVAVGQDVSAVMGTNEKLMDMYMNASDTAGELTCTLPLVPEYRDSLKSPIADIANIGASPYAGSILGGLFLKDFVKDTPWMHVDIAGPAFIEKPNTAYTQYGGSGVSVRPVLHMLRNMK